MSHFTVLVVGESPEEQLAPFSENLEMPRYVAYTKQQLIDGQRKSIEDYKNSTYAEYLKDPELYASKCKNNAHLEYLQNDFPKKLNFTEDELYQEAIRYYESNDIGEEGEVYSQSNPNSKWDFFQLGGRWAGLIEVNEGVEFNPPNFSWGWSAEDQLEVLSKRKFMMKRMKINGMMSLKDYSSQSLTKHCYPFTIVIFKATDSRAYVTDVLKIAFDLLSNA